MLDVIAAYPAADLATFLVAGIALNLTPGADVAFTTACGIAGGPRSGALAGIGVALGTMWHIGLAALGIAALMAAYPAALVAIRWGGAAYLVWLAWIYWRAGPPSEGVQGSMRSTRIVWRGFVTNALNPKVALFILAFLPQFAHPAYGPIWQQILFLGAIFWTTGLVITCSYGLLAGVAGQALGRRLGVLNKLAAVIFCGLALKFVTE